MTGPILTIILVVLISIFVIIRLNTKQVIIYNDERNRHRYGNRYGHKFKHYKKPDPNRYRSGSCRNTDCGCCPNSNRQKFDIKGSNC